MGDVAVAAGLPAATAGRDRQAAAVADLTKAHVAGDHRHLEDISHFGRNPQDWPLAKLSSFSWLPTPQDPLAQAARSVRHPLETKNQR